MKDDVEDMSVLFLQEMRESQENLESRKVKKRDENEDTGAASKHRLKESDPQLKVFDVPDQYLYTNINCTLMLNNLRRL